MVTPDMTTMLPNYRAWIAELGEAPNNDELHFASRIVGKVLLKALRNVTLLRGGTYEVAIARMHGRVARDAPEFAALGDRLFALYRRPSTEPRLILDVIDEVEGAVLPTFRST
jgi:hypothetical protein